MYKNTVNGAMYTRKDKMFQNKDQVKSVAKQIKKRIQNPNLFYVAPMTYEFD
jgi:predicted metal-dependent RNase